MERIRMKDETRKLIDQIESRLDWYFAELNVTRSQKKQNSFNLYKAEDPKVINLLQDGKNNTKEINKKSRRLSPSDLNISVYRPTA